MFQSVDIVVLRSGSPKMTVSQASGAVRVQWFDTDDRLQCHEFQTECLILWARPVGLNSDPPADPDALR